MINCGTEGNSLNGANVLNNNDLASKILKLNADGKEFKLTETMQRFEVRLAGRIKILQVCLYIGNFSLHSEKFSLRLHLHVENLSYDISVIPI